MRRHCHSHFTLSEREGVYHPPPLQNIAYTRISSNFRCCALPYPHCSSSSSLRESSDQTSTTDRENKWMTTPPSTIHHYWSMTAQKQSIQHIGRPEERWLWRYSFCSPKIGARREPSTERLLNSTQIWRARWGCHRPRPGHDDRQPTDWTLNWIGGSSSAQSSPPPPPPPPFLLRELYK